MSILNQPVVIAEVSQAAEPVSAGLASLKIDADGLLRITAGTQAISVRQGEFQSAMHRAYLASQPDA